MDNLFFGPGFGWGVIVGFVSGFAFIIALSLYIKSVTESKQNLNDTLNTAITVHRVNIECHGQIEYWFDSDSGQFLAQGPTRKEIAAMLISKFPGHAFMLESGELWVGPGFNQ